MTCGYRWKFGTWKADEVTEDYDLENWPRQDDMLPGIDWMAPQGGSDIVLPSNQVETVDGRAVGEGGYEFTWTFPYLTQDMLGYLRKTLFKESLSAEATVRIPAIRTMGGLTKFYNCIAQWPQPDIIRGLMTEGGGLVAFPVRFVRAKEVPYEQSVTMSTETLAVGSQKATVITA